MPNFPDPSKYDTNEKLILHYTKACGQQDVIMWVRDFMGKQEDTIKRLTKNQNERESEY